MGDAPKYDDCTHREIQIPSAWSEASITVDVNVGKFTSGSFVYLFVIEEDGKKSTGFGPLAVK